MADPINTDPGLIAFAGNINEQLPNIKTTPQNTATGSTTDPKASQNTNPNPQATQNTQTGEKDTGDVSIDDPGLIDEPATTPTPEEKKTDARTKLNQLEQQYGWASGFFEKNATETNVPDVVKRDEVGKFIAIAREMLDGGKLTDAQVDELLNATNALMSSVDQNIDTTGIARAVFTSSMDQLKKIYVVSVADPPAQPIDIDGQPTMTSAYVQQQITELKHLYTQMSTLGLISADSPVSAADLERALNVNSMTDYLSKEELADLSAKITAVRTDLLTAKTQDGTSSHGITAEMWNPLASTLDDLVWKVTPDRVGPEVTAPDAATLREKLGQTVRPYTYGGGDGAISQNTLQTQIIQNLDWSKIEKSSVSNRNNLDRAINKLGVDLADGKITDAEWNAFWTVAGAAQADLPPAGSRIDPSGVDPNLKGAEFSQALQASISDLSAQYARNEALAGRETSPAVRDALLALTNARTLRDLDFPLRELVVNKLGQLTIAMNSEGGVSDAQIQDFRNVVDYVANHRSNGPVIKPLEVSTESNDPALRLYAARKAVSQFQTSYGSSYAGDVLTAIFNTKPITAMSVDELRQLETALNKPREGSSPSEKQLGAWKTVRSLQQQFDPQGYADYTGGQTTVPIHRPDGVVVNWTVAQTLDYLANTPLPSKANEKHRLFEQDKAAVDRDPYVMWFADLVGGEDPTAKNPRQVGGGGRTPFYDDIANGDGDPLFPDPLLKAVFYREENQHWDIFDAVGYFYADPTPKDNKTPAPVDQNTVVAGNPSTTPNNVEVTNGNTKQSNNAPQPPDSNESSNTNTTNAGGIYINPFDSLLPNETINA